jgi:hypothetical protein
MLVGSGRLLHDAGHHLPRSLIWFTPFGQVLDADAVLAATVFYPMKKGAFH